MIAEYIDEIIMLAVGAWMTLLGFGIIAAPTGNKPAQPWLQTMIVHFRWMGPLLVVIALALAVLD